MVGIVRLSARALLLSLGAMGFFTGSASACGVCVPIVLGILHEFPAGDTLEFGDKECDNNGGCHKTAYTPGCFVHAPCGGISDEDLFATIETAIEAMDEDVLRETLTDLDVVWEYNALHGVLMVRRQCSPELLAARYDVGLLNLPAGLQVPDVVMTAMPEGHELPR